MVAAAVLPAPPLPPPPVVSPRRIPLATSCSTPVGLRHLSPFVAATFRRGRNSLSPFRIHLRVRSGVHGVFAVPECRRVFRDGFEFRVGIGGRTRSLARAGALGGNSRSFNKWDGAVEGAGMQEILVLVLKNMETGKKRRTLSFTRPSVVIGTAILTSILASRSALGRVFAASCCGTMVAAILLSILSDEEKLQLICERFQLFDFRAGDQFHAVREVIAKIANVPQRFLASRFPTVAGGCEGYNAGILTSGGTRLLIPEGWSASISRNSIENSSTKNRSLHGKPEMTEVATNISQSIANLIIVINTAELATSHADSTSRLELGIQGPFGEVQSMKVALPAQQNCLPEFSKENDAIDEAPDSETTRGFSPSNFVGPKGLEEPRASQMAESGSDGRKEDIVPILDSSKLAPEQRTSGQQLSRKSRLVKEAYKTPDFHEFSTSKSIPMERIKESSQDPPPICRIGSIPDTATQGAIVGEGLPVEGLNSNIWRRPPIDSGIAGKSPNSDGDDLHLVEIYNFLPVTDSLVGEQVPLLNDLSRSMAMQMIETQRTRSSVPDPWLNDCQSGPIEQDFLIDGDRSSSWRRKLRNGGQLLDSIVAVDEKSKTEIPRTDGSGNVRGVNRNGSVDFWGKNAGIMLKTSEQRGTLTKRKATGKGSSFGSVDDMGDDRRQERGKKFSEEEQQNFLRRGLSRNSKTDQPWNGNQLPDASRREPVRGDQRMRGDAEYFPAGDYGSGEADVNSPEILIRGTDLEVTTSSPLRSMDRWAQEGTSQSREGAVAGGDLMSSAPVGSRASPSGEMTSTMMSNGGFSRSRQGEGRSRQSIDETGVVKGNYSGSRRALDAAPNLEQKVYAVPGDGSRNGRVAPDSLGNNQSQPEMTPRDLALQRSQQNPALQFENYLDEADALLEQGMQGLEGRIEIGVAERMFSEAANLLERASEICPEDLIAVGQWGNSLLVHGQLKLKLSQQLRSMLLSPKSGSPSMWGEEAIAGRERESMKVTLQEVCEECEELLVDAGRKFRRALSLDKSDVRALYNWGLALCYRGQLISQEGGERAMEDADKLYLAAIDKFEAIIGVSQDYAAGALLNWGLAMLDRSRLRDMGDKERVQLLLQAKELFQDAVRVDPNYGQARGAVAVCSAELKELQGFEALPKQDTMERPKRNWWQR